MEKGSCRGLEKGESVHRCLQISGKWLSGGREQQSNRRGRRSAEGLFL